MAAAGGAPEENPIAIANEGAQRTTNDPTGVLPTIPDPTENYNGGIYTAAWSFYVRLSEYRVQRLEKNYNKVNTPALSNWWLAVPDSADSQFLYIYCWEKGVPQTRENRHMWTVPQSDVLAVAQGVIRSPHWFKANLEDLKKKRSYNGSGGRRKRSANRKNRRRTVRRRGTRQRRQ